MNLRLVYYIQDWLKLKHKPQHQPQTTPVTPVDVVDAPQDITTTPNKIEVDVKYMSISNGKLIIHL